MTDIVERLRANVKWLERDGFLTNARNTEEAADEIERLRTELAAEKQAHHYTGLAAHAEAQEAKE